jgi:hypothetical protein
VTHFQSTQDLAPSREDMAEYLTDAIEQLKCAASRSGFEFVAYVLDIARLAALEAAGCPQPVAPQTIRPLHS